MTPTPLGYIVCIGITLGLPVLVGGDPRGRGVVAAASYEARRFGCRSAMPMAQALRLCPDAHVVSGRMARYQEVSREVFAIFERYTPLVEGLCMAMDTTSAPPRSESIAACLCSSSPTAPGAHASRAATS